MKFSEELNNYIEKIGCTPKDINEVSGLSASLISRYLNDKRTPKVNSQYFDKLVNSLFILAKNRNVKLSKEEITKTLQKSINYSGIDFDTFISNFNLLIPELEFNINKFAESIGCDNSFISRIRNKTRKPANIDEFVGQTIKYIVHNYHSVNNLKSVYSITKCSINDLRNIRGYENVLRNWMSTNGNRNNDIELVRNFLTNVDKFDLNEYLESYVSIVRLPAKRSTPRQSKFSFGMKGRITFEKDFIKDAISEQNNEKIFYYSTLPAFKDEEYQKNWILTVAMILKKRIPLDVIFDVHKPLNELFGDLEKWLPLYLAGQITPYYFKTNQNTMFPQIHCTANNVALSGESFRQDLEHSQFYLTSNKEDLTYLLRKTDYLLSNAYPLIDIYTNEKKFNKFLEKHENTRIKKVSKLNFETLDFLVSDKWVVINKNSEIHLVIQYKELKEVIELFLNK